MSKKIAIIPRRYLTALRAPPKGLLPQAIAEITLCKTDKVPPVMSHKILKIFHPSVLPLFIFHRTYTVYLHNDIHIFMYPNIFAKLAFEDMFPSTLNTV